MDLWFLDECLNHYNTLAFCCHPKHVSFARVTLRSFFLKEFVMQGDIYSGLICILSFWKANAGRMCVFSRVEFPFIHLLISSSLPFLFASLLLSLFFLISFFIILWLILSPPPPPLLSAHATLCLVYCDVTEKPKTFHVWQYTSRDIF